MKQGQYPVPANAIEENSSDEDEDRGGEEGRARRSQRAER